MASDGAISMEYLESCPIAKVGVVRNKVDQINKKRKAEAERLKNRK